MLNWAVTGGSGWLGGHVLSASAAASGADAERNTIAWGRRRPVAPCDLWMPVDLLDARSIADAIAHAPPDVVIHAAGRTPPGSADDLHASNVVATLHLLAALRDAARPARVVLAGSAAELGPVPVVDLPVGESYPARPVEAYGRAKLRATEAGLAAGAPLEVVVGRVFNPVGPGAPSNQALGKFARELAQICRRGAASARLRVGDLDAKRDFIDVRDVARALVALAEQGRAGQVYHIGTGTSRRVGDGLEMLIQLAGIEVALDVDPGLIHPDAPRDSRASIAKIQSETGWSPTIAFEASVAAMWAEAVRAATFTPT